MDSIALFFLLEVYEQIDIFLLVMVRMLGFFMIMPVLSSDSVPMTTRIGLAMASSYMIIINQPLIIEYTNTVPAFTLLIIREFLVGFTLAFVVYLIFIVVHFAGQIIDFQIGFSMVSVFDPITQIQVPITGNLFYLIITALFVMTGGFHVFIHALIYSYNIVPIGDAVFVGNNNLIFFIISLITSYLLMGVRIAMPIMGTILIIDVALGLLVKAVPQMNVFVVGMPIKLLIGFMIMLSVYHIFIEIYEMFYLDAIRQIFNTLRSLVPNGTETY